MIGLDLKINLDPNRVKDNLIFVAGLPGMGLTGKQAADYLIEQFNASKVGCIKASHLASPVISSHDGVVEDLMNELFQLYYADVGEKSFLIFTGITQPSSPEWQHHLSYKIVDQIRVYRPKIIYTFAATPIYSYRWAVNVYGIATRRDLLEELRLYGVIPFKGEGVISGVNGLLVGYGKRFGIDGIILLGETYLTAGRDLIAPLSLLRVFSKIVNVEIDLRKMEDLALSFHKKFSEYVKREKSEETDSEKLGYIS
ncbi:MAG: PAC2 family protein [Nitrososphaeria archaeon]|nr:PAC2 family protein [Nitrososphaeria archaeon]